MADAARKPQSGPTRAAPGKKKGRTTLILSGGAPNFPMMAGALLALHRAGVKFDLISMTGAGSVLGLIYLAPKDMTQVEALENTVNYGIADALYAMLPVNYKMFQKGGYRADRFRQYCNSNPYLRRVMDQRGMNRGDKLRSDAMQFMLAAMCPSDLNIYSTGLCAHAPFIEHVVDFTKLKTQPIDCVLNAYCIEDKKVREWRKEEIDVHHFRASLSFPFLYPPYRVDGKHYYEGAAYEALNLGGIGFDDDPDDLDLFPDSEGEQHLDRIIVFDIMNGDLVKRPRNLWEAYGQSIILPLVANARNEEKFIQIWQSYGHLFGPLKTVNLTTPSPADKKLIDSVQTLLDRVNEQADSARPLTIEKLREELPPQILKIDFPIPADHQLQTLEWKRSNLEYLFKLGVKCGDAFVVKFPELKEAPEANA
jgi:NTE family protein